MKTTSGRIPKAVDTLNSYINNTTNYLLADSPVVPLPPTVGATVAAVPTPFKNWQRLTMIQTEMDAWVNYKNQWNLLFSKYSDKEESRTTAITTKLHGVETNFRRFAQPILTMIAGVRTVTDDDAAVLNIVIHRAEPVHPITPIDQIPTFSATPIGGAEVKFSVRPTHDSTRASKLPDATAVEIRYEVGDVCPPEPTVCTQMYISTKSIFILSLPGTAKGKTMHVSARWIIANDPARNGPWSGMFSVVVA
jgi:hypothetical protein